jgi:hypothetical protein
MDEQFEIGAGVRPSPFEHLEVAVGIPECGDGLLPDEALNLFRLSRSVID